MSRIDAKAKDWAAEIQLESRRWVRPYYIYMADQVAGGEHFRTTVQKGLEIIQALRGWTSGLAVPQFVIDAPGGGGKVPLLPEHVEEINDDEVIFRNFQGQRSTCKQPKPEAQPDIVPIEIGKRTKKTARPRRKKAAGSQLARLLLLVVDDRSEGRSFCNQA